MSKGYLVDNAGIQKLNNLMKSESDLPIYSKQVVFILMSRCALSRSNRRTVEP
jgi:hypothetical protein